MALETDAVLLTEAEGEAELFGEVPYRTGRSTRRVALVGLPAAAALLVVGTITSQRAGAQSESTSGSHVQHLIELVAKKEASCIDFPGVKLDEGKDATPAWDVCNEKWGEDCRTTRCCKDAGLQCYEKNAKWGACLAKCSTKDEKNETWSCKLLEPETPRTPESCTGACRKKADCQQSVYSAEEGGKCALSSTRSHKVVWVASIFNSSYCGGKKADRQAAEAKVQEQLPFQMPVPPIVNCSWAGDDCSSTKCCNEMSCTADFTSCSGYQCYKKKDGFAGCVMGDAPAGWDGTWLGGTKEFRQIQPAGENEAVQGTSLYCFMVVSWDLPAPKPFWDSEATMANVIKEQGVSVFLCDGHDLYDGIPSPKAEWGSFSNIDAFLQIWQQVRDRGTFRNHDWTVKVDVDAVFFPDRLKQHLEVLRAPRGSRIYLENTQYKFKFMGALEILTREAVEFYVEHNKDCIRGEHAGGEDFFMKGCMDAIGIDHMSDYDLLRDKYAEEHPIECTNKWVTTFHFRKKVPSWWWCHNMASCGNEESCGRRLEDIAAPDESEE